MQPLLCATGNAEKFGGGKSICQQYGVQLEQVVLDIDEIQGEDPVRIATDKAQKAFVITGKPVIITDDSWNIPGLNGFPGPYMKSIIHWFTAEDFIRLTKELKDRRIILEQHVVYADANGTKVFHDDIPGQLATSPRGTYGPASMKVIEMNFDGGKTISEVYDAGLQHSPERVTQRANEAWGQFAQWYSQLAV